MSRYNAFYVNFATKGFFNNDVKGYKILGTAYYLYNEKFEIYKQFIQLKKANFRPTDKEMLSTSFYNSCQTNPIKKNIRNYLEKIQKSKGYEINEISKKNKIRISLSNVDLIHINKKLLEMNRIKMSIDIFTGSNSSGAESNVFATDIITYDNYNIENGLNFTNPLNKFSLSKNKEFIINNLDELKLINLSDFLMLNSDVNNIFRKYNYSQYFIFQSFEKNENMNNILEQVSSEIILKKVKITNNEEFVYEKVNNLIADYKNNILNIEKNKLVSRLRNYQKVFVQYEIMNLIESGKLLKENIANNFIENSNQINCEYAHIFPVSELVRKEEFFKIADKNNCLLLEPSLHTAYDKHQVIFDSNGDLCSFLKPTNKLGIKIKKIFLNDYRKEYINEYWK